MFAIKKFSWALVMAALCAVFTPALAADEPAEKKKPAREGGEKRRGEEWKKLSPAEREAKRDEIKARLEKRVAALREKKEKKTISEQEERELARSEQILKRFGTMESKEQPLLRGPRTNTPAAPAPPEK